MRRPLLPLLAVAAALAACGPEASSVAAKGAGGPPPAVPIEVAEARRDTVIDAIEATGGIEAVQSIELRPDVDGRIAEILVREGTLVAKGAALFRIDDAERRAEVERARAERDLARQALERTRELIALKASSQADLERAEATARSTQASLDLLTIRLDRSVVRAPFAGVVGQRFVSIGDFVTSATRLAALQTVSPQRAVLQVPERFYRDLKLGQKVAFRVAALPGKDFIGTVEFVDPSVQLPARTVTVKALVPNPRNELHPGMFIEAKLATAVRTAATVIPEDAVLPSAGKMYAFVVKDGKAERREIVLGVRTPGYVEVTSGILAGEQVAVSGLERLTDGAAVKAQAVDRTPAAREAAE
jgi:membrane fusion protein (multidrug efflux system)